MDSEHIFLNKIAPSLFWGCHSQSHPTLVFVGAPPAAGKTQANSYIKQAYVDNGVVIEGDSFRAKHPDYSRIMATNRLEMPGKTAQFSGQIVRMALDMAKEHRYSIILEGTFRNLVMVLQTAHEFYESGYTLRAATIATPPEVCVLSAEQRFIIDPQGRWTPFDAQVQAWAGFTQTVDALHDSAHVASLDIFTRDHQVSFAASERPSQVIADTIEGYWDTTTATAWCKHFEKVWQAAQNVIIAGKPYVYHDNTAWPYLHKTAQNISHIAGITLDCPPLLTQVNTYRSVFANPDAACEPKDRIAFSMGMETPITHRDTTLER